MSNKTHCKARRTEKEVSWAYPSSISAAKFGFGMTGCFIVSVGKYRMEAESGHATMEAAFERADKLPEPYSRFSIEKKQALSR